jgi:N-methylhydantoinase B/oxoprolinase/acetone carboxylase alpha subunit
VGSARRSSPKREHPCLVERPADRRAFGAQGRAGGAAGAVTLRRAGSDVEVPLPGEGYLDLRRGDVISLVGAGGGGFGVSSALEGLAEKP